GLRIAYVVGVQVNDANFSAVLEFDFTEIVEMLVPISIFRQVGCDAASQQDVSAISQIHYPLGDVDPGTGNVDPIIHIFKPVHWTAMDSHPNRDTRMVL